MNTLTGVTATDRQTVDTVTFWFYDKLPATSTATYVGTKVPTGPNGKPVQCDGQTFVVVTLSSAQAHDVRGAVTAPQAVYAKDVASLAEACLLRDSGGKVQYALGLKTTKAPELLVGRFPSEIQGAQIQVTIYPSGFPPTDLHLPPEAGSPRPLWVGACYGSRQVGMESPDPLGVSVCPAGS